MKSDLLYVFAESFSKSTNAFQKWPLLSLTIKARARSSTGEFILLNVVECRLWTLSGRVCAMWGPKKKWTNVRGKTEFKLHWNWKTNDFCCETAFWVQIKILLVLLWNSHTSVRSFICSGCLKSSMDYQLYLCCLICHGVFPGTKIKDKNTLGGEGKEDIYDFLCVQTISGSRSNHAHTDTDTGIISVPRDKEKGISKCQQRHKESADTERPLLDSRIFHDHITVSFASVSKRTTLILLHCECFWGSSLFSQIYPLNVKYWLRMEERVRKKTSGHQSWCRLFCKVQGHPISVPISH